MQRMRIEELLASIERGCKQLSGMIDAILTCSRLMRGRMEPVNLDLNCKYDVQIYKHPRLLITVQLEPQQRLSLVALGENVAQNTWV